MRRIPTTSLRSTLLALLLTLCLALPALAAQKEGLLLVAFGTSVPEAQPALTAIDKEFKAAFPHSPVIWAYTSSIIRAKLEKKGVHIGDVAAGLEELARQKVDVVRVQSLHVVAGEEFSEMERLLVSWLVRHPDSFKAVYLGRPLLESRQDAEDVCRAVLGATEGKRKSGELLALMGHGHDHRRHARHPGRCRQPGRAGHGGRLARFRPGACRHQDQPRVRHLAPALHGGGRGPRPQRPGR